MSTMRSTPKAYKVWGIGVPESRAQTITVEQAWAAATLFVTEHSPPGTPRAHDVFVRNPLTGETKRWTMTPRVVWSTSRARLHPPLQIVRPHG